MNDIFLIMNKKCFNIKFDSPCGHNYRIKPFPDYKSSIWEAFWFYIFVPLTQSGRKVKNHKNELILLLGYTCIYRS